MQREKPYGTGVLYTFTNYIYYFMTTNLYFVAANILFLFFLMTLIQSVSNSFLYYLALIPAGPAISALFYTMDKLIRTKELSPARDFLYGYKSNLKETVFIWLGIISVLFILIIDVHYLLQMDSFLHMIFSAVIYVFLAGWLVLSLNIMILNSTFSFRKRDLIKIAVFYTVNKWKATLANLLLLTAAGFLLAITTDFLLLFAFSLLAFMLMKQSQEMMDDAERKFVNPAAGKTILREEGIS